MLCQHKCGLFTCLAKQIGTTIKYSPSISLSSSLTYTHTHTECSYRDSASVHHWPASQPSSGRYRRSSRWSAPLSARDSPWLRCLPAVLSHWGHQQLCRMLWGESHYKRIRDTHTESHGQSATTVGLSNRGTVGCPGQSCGSQVQLLYLNPSQENTHGIIQNPLTLSKDWFLIHSAKNKLISTDLKLHIDM